MALIFYFSSLAGAKIPVLFAFQDLLSHLIIYGILGYLFARALKKSFAKLDSRSIIYMAVILGFLYGVSDEFHQLFVPQRCVSGLDLFFDGVGSLIGSLIYR
jgi:VanZ family protein